MTEHRATNLADLLHATAAARPDDVAFVDSVTRRETTWATLDASVDAMAAGLRRHGLERGDRVALLLGNRIEFVAVYFAVLRAGMVALPLNTGYTAHEVADLLSRSGARLLVADEQSEATAAAATSELATALLVVGDPEYVAIERAG